MLVLSKKDKANPLLMESRKLLLNQVDVGEDGRLNAVDEIRTFRYGAAEGEHKVRISGITTRDFFYRTKYNRTKAVYQASEAMKNIGRRANLQCMDDAAACIIKSPIFYPVVIVFYENSDGRMQLSAFTAKAFMSLFAINSALKKFDKQLPDTMVRKVSVHSVHDVNRAIIHSLKSLVSKEDDNNGINDDREYVDLKKLFKAGRRNRRGADGRVERIQQQSEMQENEDSIHTEYDREQAGLRQENSAVDDNRSYESRQERKARKKAERLEKKREAARRKYEKLMGEDMVKTLVGETPVNQKVVVESVDALVNDGYSEEENDDIMMEFTGMTADELDAMNESGDETDAYDDETDEDIMRGFTGMSSNGLYDNCTKPLARRLVPLL